MRDSVFEYCYQPMSFINNLLEKVCDVYQNRHLFLLEFSKFSYQLLAFSSHQLPIYLNQHNQTLPKIEKAITYGHNQISLVTNTKRLCLQSKLRISKFTETSQLVRRGSMAKCPLCSVGFSHNFARGPSFELRRRAVGNRLKISTQLNDVLVRFCGLIFFGRNTKNIRKVMGNMILVFFRQR